MTNCDICEDRLGLVLGCDNCQPKDKNMAEQQDNQREFWDRAVECGMCGPRITARMEQDCSGCGLAVRKAELERVLLGNDVIGLFPNIKSKNSARIVRQKVEKSEVVFEGFDYKHGGRYIVMNKSYTGDLKPLWNVLP